MLPRNRSDRAFLLCLIALLFSLAPLHTRAQDDTTAAPEKHGRKYKSPPDTSHVEVTVLKDFNKKPIMNAAVIFRPTKDGIDEGNLELKTDPEGKAAIDVIPTGSKVTIQVIADGFSTFSFDCVGHLVGVFDLEIENGDFRSAFSQGLRHGRAENSSSACNHCDFAAKIDFEWN